MAFSKGRKIRNTTNVLNKTNDLELLDAYFGIKQLPTLINSPFREDRKPSFGIYLRDMHVLFKDYSTGESGNIYEMLKLKYNITYKEVINLITEDLNLDKRRLCNCTKVSYLHKASNTTIKARARGWNKQDKEYWNQFNISIDLLTKANVYPIDRYSIIKDCSKTFKADDLAYTFVEFKDNNVTMKLYQPYNKIKFISSHTYDVISLWCLLPKTGENLIICSSLKDALCTYSITNIPTISLQSETVQIKPIIVEELSSRFKNIYILYDGDKAGLENSNKLAQKTGFISIPFPYDNPKDISDWYKEKRNTQEIKNYILQHLKKKNDRR